MSGRLDEDRPGSGPERMMRARQLARVHTATLFARVRQAQGKARNLARSKGLTNNSAIDADIAEQRLGDALALIERISQREGWRE